MSKHKAKENKLFLNLTTPNQSNPQNKNITTIKIKAKSELRESAPQSEEQAGVFNAPCSLMLRDWCLGQNGAPIRLQRVVDGQEAEAEAEAPIVGWGPHS